MRFFNSLFSFYVQSNMHVALAVSSLTILTGVYFNIDSTFSSWFLGASTFLSYNAIRYLKYKTGILRVDIEDWFIRSLKYLQLSSLIVIMFLIVLISKLKIVDYLVLLPFFSLTLLYMIPVFKSKNQLYSLRQLPGVKIFSIAVSWAGLITFLPLLRQEVVIDIKVLGYFILQFFFVIVLTIPFDIRDFLFDSKKLKTIPQVIGIKGAKLLGIVLLILLFLIHICVFKDVSYIPLLVVILFLSILLWKSNSHQHKYYASFWVEGIPIIWVLLLNLFDKIYK